MRLDLTGKEVDDTSVSGSFDSCVDRDFVIGNETTGNRGFDGTINDVKTWTRVLDKDELEDNADTFVD